MLLDNFSAATQSSAHQFEAHQLEAHQLEAEKMDEIIDFILQGKYSSACLLLLESTGQDPLHYIPYRTYNRLQKQRQQALMGNVKAKDTAATGGRSRLTDLDYVESLPEQLRVVQGGYGTVLSNVRPDIWSDIQPERSRISSSQHLPVWQHRINVSCYAQS